MIFLSSLYDIIFYNEVVLTFFNKQLSDMDYAPGRGGSSFFQGGGVDPTTMRSIVHEPASRFLLCYFEPP